MSKKRRLSPSASSRSSATPAPTVPSVNTLQLDASSPAPEPVHVGAEPIHGGTLGTTRMGTLVPGSGDGTTHGDECFMWTDLAMNKQGYRYVPCGPSPNPSPSPLFPFYRTLPGPPSCPPIHLSWLDRSPFLRLSPNALTATTDRGFRSGRANIGVREGTWYYEAVIERGDGARGGGGATGGDSGNAHVRIGWGRREANFDGPVGMDGYGYGIRDVGGEKLHISRPRPYGRSFGTGDVIGCLITLPPRQPTEIRRKRVPIRYKGQLYFEMDEYGVQKEMEALVDREGKAAAAAAAAPSGPSKGKKKEAPPRQLPTLPGSRIEFFLNGEPLGTAFEDIYDFAPLPPASSKKEKDIIYDDGSLGYFPMISTFGRGKVKCNFGPEWRFPPAVDVRPMVDRFDEFRAEEAAHDERDEAKEAIRLRKEMEAMEERERGWKAKQIKEPKVATPLSKATTSKESTPRPGTPKVSTRETTPEVKKEINEVNMVKEEEEKEEEEAEEEEGDDDIDEEEEVKEEVEEVEVPQKPENQEPQAQEPSQQPQQPLDPLDPQERSPHSYAE